MCVQVRLAVVTSLWIQSLECMSDMVCCWVVYCINLRVDVFFASNDYCLFQSSWGFTVYCFLDHARLRTKFRC